MHEIIYLRVRSVVNKLPSCNCLANLRFADICEIFCVEFYVEYAIIISQ